MENLNSIKAVNSSNYLECFRKPLYGSYCFSRIPETIKSLFDGKWRAGALPKDVIGDFAAKYNQVVCFFVDGFSWDFIERATSKELIPTFSALREKGVMSKMTSLFPSTTVVHLIAMHTGLQSLETGVLEWFYYESDIEKVIAPLLFSPARSEEPLELLKEGITGESFLPRSGFYPELQSLGIKPYNYSFAPHVKGAFNKIVLNASEAKPYSLASEGLLQLNEDLNCAGDECIYAHFYDGSIDTTSHEFGPESPECEKAMKDFWGLFESNLLTKLKPRSDRLLLFTADHGQAGYDPEEVIYVDESYPEICSMLRSTRDGSLIAPGGTSRDLFLYLKPECIEDAKGLLSKALKGKAEVCRGTDLLNDGIWGDAEVTDRFRANMPDLVVLPQENQAVFWADPDRFFVSSDRGNHGGLTPKEMDTFLLAVET